MRLQKSSENPPLNAAGFRDLWRDCGAPSRIALAVSGGPDSMALMMLAAPLQKSDGVALLALTVDHGLRPESAGEAKRVAQWANDLGVEHKTLNWTGDKPATGLQEAARAARYRLLAREAEEGGFDAVFTGHNKDDQAETVFMRLARGSGPAGLSAMAAKSFIAAGAGAPIALIRPLLHETQSSLRAVLAAAGQEYVDDPSNIDPAFERVRTRALLAALEEQQILTRDALCKTGERMRAADNALRAAQEMRWKELGGVFLRWGGAAFDPKTLQSADAELLARLIHSVSGAFHPPNPAQAVSVIEILHTGGEATLGGCTLQRHRGALYVFREPAALTGRSGVGPAQPVPLAPGDKTVWDGRFIVHNRGARAVEIGALGQEQAVYLALKPNGFGRFEGLFDGPKTALASAPALFEGGELTAAAGLSPSAEFKPLCEERFYQKLARFC